MRAKLLCLIIVISFLFCSCSFLTSEDASSTQALSEGDALFHFIDVGQGDSCIIQTNDAVVLIDAGTSEGGAEVYNYLEKNDIDYIDCVILTHPHEDHIGGASKILSGIDVGDVYMNGESSTAFSFEELINLLDEKDITPTVPEIGSVYTYGSLKLKFISPTHNFSDENDNSLVTMVNHGNVKALFTGDAESPVETEILQANDLKADILKVSHHGSRNASSMTFLREVLPGVCVIQCGKDNSYGHPHKETIERLEKIGSEILRTDESGTIVLRSDGNAVSDINNNEYKEISSTTKKADVYIANKKSKVFHTNECKNLPEDKNRLTFNDRKQAEEGGYTPCSNCNP